MNDRNPGGRRCGTWAILVLGLNCIVTVACVTCHIVGYRLTPLEQEGGVLTEYPKNSSARSRVIQFERGALELMLFESIIPASFDPQEVSIDFRVRNKSERVLVLDFSKPKLECRERDNTVRVFPAEGGSFDRRSPDDKWKGRVVDTLPFLLEIDPGQEVRGVLYFPIVPIVNEDLDMYLRSIRDRQMMLYLPIEMANSGTSFQFNVYFRFD